MQQETNTKATESQEKSIRGHKRFSAFPLYEHKTPIFKENERTGYVDYGQDNNYPDYLAYLYNRSAIHATIINSKNRYIIGEGWQVNPMLNTIDAAKATKAMKSVNSYQTLNELTEELGLEKLVYGGYAIRGKWNPLTKDIAWIKVQPFDTIRTNKQKTQFYISTEWTAEMSLNTRWKKGRGFPPNTITLPKFNPANKKGEFIFYVCDSRPQMKVYPLPEYEGGIAAIETDVEVKNFDLNNVKSGFAAGTMITFFDGEVENEEEQVKLERDIKGKVAGTDNGGEILLNWQMPGTAAPILTQLRSNELANQFEQLDPRVTSSIIMAHAITSPMLFGIKTEGQLGGRSELRTAWEHFYNTYVKPKQTKLEQDVNYIMSFFGLPENCYNIIGLEPIGIEVDLQTMKEALQPDEFSNYIRDKLGLKPIVLDDTQVILNTLGSLSPIVANKLMNSISVNELRKLVGLKPIEGGETISEPEVAEITETFHKKKPFAREKFAEDKLLFELTNKLGVKAEDYEIVMKGMGYDFEAPANLEGDNLKVYDALTKKPKIGIAELAKLTKLSEGKLLQILENLNKANYIGLKITEVNGKPQIESKISIVEPEEQEKGFILETKWRYEGPKDSRNRDFCSKMLAANRLYTRAEIDQLENDMEEYNTSVWRYRGGWYHNPALDVNTPQCRHFWEQVLTKKRA